MKHFSIWVLKVALIAILGFSIATTFTLPSSNNTTSIDNSFDSGTTEDTYICEAQPSCDNAANCSTSRFFEILKAIIYKAINELIKSISKEVALQIITRFLLKKRSKKDRS